MINLIELASEGAIDMHLIAFDKILKFSMKIRQEIDLFRVLHQIRFYKIHKINSIQTKKILLDHVTNYYIIMNT